MNTFIDGVKIGSTGGGGGGSDNLGNHIATQILDLNGNDIIGVNNVNATSVDGDVSSTTVNSAILDNNLSGVSPNLASLFEAIDNFVLSGAFGNPAEADLNMAGYSILDAQNVTAVQILGNLSGCTVSGTNFSGNLSGVVDPTLENIFQEIDDLDLLVNHTAETNLNMAGHSISGALNVTAVHILGNLSGCTVSGTNFSGNLSGVVDPTLENIFQEIDDLDLPGNYPLIAVPFNYMNLSKIFTTGLIGWATEEEDITYFYSAGGYETSSTTTMYSGTAWIDMPIPLNAVGFASGDALVLEFVSNSTNTGFCKLDIEYITSRGGHSFPTTRWTTGSFVPAGQNVPELLTVPSADLSDPNWSGESVNAKLKIEWYSKSGCSVKLINGYFGFQ